MSATTAFGFAASPFLAVAPASPPRIIPRARLARPPPGAPAAFLAYCGSGSAMAEDATAVLYYCSRAPAPAQLRPDASSLLPHDYHRGPQRIADVGRYWAMPNLRPLKDTDDGKINAMKVASVLILGAVLGALIQSNVQASRDVAPTAGADVDVDPLDAEAARLGSFATKSTASGAHVAGLADDGKKLFVADLARGLAGTRGAVTTHPVPEGWAAR